MAGGLLGKSLNKRFLPNEHRHPIKITYPRGKTMNFNFRPSKTGFVLVCGRRATAHSHTSHTQGDIKLGQLQDALPMLLGQKGKGTEIGKLANSENFVDQAICR